MGMPETLGVEAVLEQAGGKGREYDWLGAIESYKRALDLVSDDFSRIGEIYERLGYALYRAAMQSESQEEFRDRMRQAVAHYEKAKEFYGRLGEQGKVPRMLRCDAMIAYMSYWLTTEVPEKKRLLDEGWRLTKEALKAFEEAADALEYGRTFNQLSISALFGSSLDYDFETRQKTMTVAIEHGEKAIRFLFPLRDPFELARAYVRTATYLQAYGYYFLNLDKRQGYYQKATDYWQKANALSEETALIELLNSLGMVTLESDWGWGTDVAVANFEKALHYGKKTKDRFIVGVAFSWLAFNISLKLGERILDPDEGVPLLNKALQYAEDAKLQFSVMSFISPIYGALWAEAPLAEYYWDLAAWETDRTKRRDLLEKAKEAVSDQLKRAEESKNPEVIMFAHIEFSTILLSLAMIETNSEGKKSLLKKALRHRNEAIQLNEQFVPFFYWYRGFNQNYLAIIKSELANLIENPEPKKSMLQEAILDKENAMKLCIKHTTFWEGQGYVSSLFPVLGGWQYGYGDLLIRLYEFTNNREHLQKAIGAFEDAAKSFHKHNLTSRIAECYWKVAQVYDNLNEHLKAAENFDLALNNYKKAAENIPQLKDFYQDHASYMQAWSEIEKSSHYHGRQEFGVAKKHFENASSLLKQLSQWSYLAQNYAAWSQVEHAEDLSRNERSEEAIQAFGQATDLFSESKKTFQTNLSKIESPDEKQMATNLVKAADLRREYCIARIAIEEAKILDKKGDHTGSSEKYASAAQTLEKVTQGLESEQDRKEIQYIACVSQALQKMMLADARVSPELYLEASRIFEQASKYSSSEVNSLLALGHSRFCKALEAGTRFTDTRDATFYSEAMKYLQSANGYYQRAGLSDTAEYAKATGLFLDAYVYMDNAKEETDPEKKARLYIMTEKVLQASAGSYTKANHQEKRELVLRLLEAVKEERQLAVSMTEVLHVPIMASTTALPSLAPTSEKAVGLERFEHADIRANVITHQKALKVGENLDLEIELVNAGKGAALLTRITEVIPEGFDLKEKPEICRLEDSYLNMKGRRLDPLKVEEIRLVLKPRVQGVFSLRPRILYLDEDGKYKAHEPEPVTITVKELGIKGWLKGPEKTK